MTDTPTPNTEMCECGHSRYDHVHADEREVANPDALSRGICRKCAECQGFDEANPTPDPTTRASSKGLDLYRDEATGEICEDCKTPLVLRRSILSSSLKTHFRCPGCGASWEAKPNV